MLIPIDLAIYLGLGGIVLGALIVLAALPVPRRYRSHVRAGSRPTTPRLEN
jgi:hypothetical protein